MIFKLKYALSSSRETEGSGETRSGGRHGEVYRELLRKVATKPSSPAGAGEDVVAASQLPSHSDIHESCLTGKRIQVRIHNSL